MVMVGMVVKLLELVLVYKIQMDLLAFLLGKYTLVCG
jgi:hypothetical protein